MLQRFVENSSPATRRTPWVGLKRATQNSDMTIRSRNGFDARFRAKQTIVAVNCHRCWTSQLYLLPIPSAPTSRVNLNGKRAKLPLQSAWQESAAIIREFKLKIMNFDHVDPIATITHEEDAINARNPQRVRKIFSGISSGTATDLALRLASETAPRKYVLVVCKSGIIYSRTNRLTPSLMPGELQPEMRLG